MRKMTKRLMVFMLMAVMIFALTACGGNEEQSSEPETAGVTIDYGESELYTQEELEDAVAMINEEFDSWEGCEMHSIAYAGDECNTDENIQWLSSLNDDADYDTVCEFICDFHSPVEGGGAWEPDTEYTDYQFWLAKNADGCWDLVSWGY